MSEHPLPTEKLDNPEVSHEQSDVNVRGILTVAGGLIVVCAVCYMVVSFLYAGLNEKANQLHRSGSLLSENQELNGVAGPHLEEFDRLQGNTTDIGPSKKVTPAEELERARVEVAMDKIVQQNLLPARPRKPGESKP